MKISKPILLFFVLIYNTLHIQPLHSQTSNFNYSIKNRWSVKASISRYKTAFFGQPVAIVGDNFTTIQNRKMINFKIEANYGIFDFIEVGIFSGFQHYEWFEDFDSEIKNNGFAPLFGINANFHILPFLVTSESCGWDFYLTTKYGGCYLPHKEYDHPDFQCSKYRQEYGLGVGLGYYFKNIIGLFAEGSVGQYFFFKRFEIGIAQGNSIEFKDFSDSNFSFRIGVAAKF